MEKFRSDRAKAQTILDNWSAWDAEAGERAQCEQDSDAYRELMLRRIQATLSPLEDFTPPDTKSAAWKAGRAAALEEQERLFPRKMMRVYDDRETPTNQWVSVPPNLCTICMDLRASFTGASDPWKDSDVREVVAMLRGRLKYWWPEKDPFDSLVREMVRGTADFAESALSDRGW